MKLPALLLLALLASCGGGGGSGGDTFFPPPPAPPPPPQPFTVSTSVVASGFTQPVYATAPAGDARLFVVERDGRIVILQGGTRAATPFLDISARTTTEGERGLLSLAFDPAYADNGFFYVFFTDPNGDLAIERFRVSAADPNVADPTPLRILTIPHRDFTNHNGGLLRFGPDGFLYLGTGDGGGGGDPLRSGQDLDSLLGKLLRIDVRNASIGQPYTVPPDNPFVGQLNRRPEIWAYGLRNPWRWAFDESTNRLYIGDVGQSSREEVDVSPADSGGLNYGWNITEGTTCFGADVCSVAGITLPVLEYGHNDDGGCAVTGGAVYRGTAFPELQGRYFYSDLCSGWLRSFVFAGGAATGQQQFIAKMGTVLSFAEDGQRELYVLTSEGQVLRLDRVFLP